MSDDTPRPDLDDEDDDDRPRRRRRRPPPQDAMDDPAMRFVLPVNTSALSIAAGYLGLISVLCFPAPIALVVGIIALLQLKKNPKMHGRGRAIFGIVMGALFTVGPLVGLLLVSILGP